jgi:hypothetical protein
VAAEETGLNGMEAPMTIFDAREKGFERRFAHEEEEKFRATARRNHLAGLWTAQKLGLAGAEAEAYAQSIVTVDLDSPGSDAVFAKIDADLRSHGIPIPDDQIRRMISDFMKQAAAGLNSLGR